MNAKSKDRMAFSMFVWLQTTMLCGWMDHMLVSNCVPLGFNVELFICLTVCFFALGHSIEWYYHVFTCPLAEERQGHTAKLIVFSIFMLTSTVTGLTTVVVLFVDVPNALVIGCFLILSLLIVISFRCRGILEWLKHLLEFSKPVNNDFAYSDGGIELV